MEKYKDPNEKVKTRVADLLDRMSFEQKIDQLNCLVTISKDIPDFKSLIPNGIGHVGAFTIAEDANKIADYVFQLQKYLVEETSLGIPALIHCEASAGAQFTEADVFPSAIAQASTFSDILIHKMACIIGEQMFAMGFRQALSPVLDITRDPRWGRLTETYGEDPCLTSAMGCAFIAGIQKTNLKDGVLATGKHFVGHGTSDGGINMARNSVTERELYEVHCKPFQAAISLCNLSSVMHSYGSIDGEPIVCSKKILTEVLRNQLGFEGFVVSDYIAIDRIIDPFCITDSFIDAGIKALNAGLDVEFPRPKGVNYKLKSAIEDGRLDISIIDKAVERVLITKFKLGLFESATPDRKKLFASLHRKETQDLNLEMALSSCILLKNEHNLLPLSKKTESIAVIGPHGDSVRSFFGTFSYPAVIDMTMSREEDGQEFDEPGLIIYDIEQKFPGQIRDNTPRIEKKIRIGFKESRSLLDALKEYLPKCRIEYEKGINFSGTDLGGEQAALNCAAGCDVVILALGGKNGWGATSTIGEGIDSTNIGLPGYQEEFAKKIKMLNKKTVVLHFDGRPLSSEYIASAFEAILEVWQPGEFGGQALTRILFGDYNPAGRLPVTAARNSGQIPVYYSQPRGTGFRAAGHTGMIRNKNGYINDTAFPLFHFGHGLSYTHFTYSNMQCSKKYLNVGEKFNIQVDIHNSGEYDGEEVVQLYFSDDYASMVLAEIQLAGFKRIFIKHGETKTVSFELETTLFSFLDACMDWIVEKGTIAIMIGKSSSDICLRDSIEILETKKIDAKRRCFFASASIAS